MSAQTTDRLHALAAAREILKQNPGASPMQLAALAWLEGRITLCKELRQSLDPPPSIHEYDCMCPRCGRRAGSRHVIAKDAPPHGYFEVTCFHCSAGDEPRAA